MKRVAVLQSNYIPWKGYFDIIDDVDLFVFYDDVQFTKNDWRNRNLIKTPKGTEWLTVPVGQDISRAIDEVRITEHSWQKKHLKSIRQNYSRASHFAFIEGLLEELYVKHTWQSLSELNRFAVEYISQNLLGIETTFALSRDYAPQGARLDRLMDLLEKCSADVYVSGPSAKSYIDDERFSRAGIELVYKDYASYPEYPQFHPPFVHGVSVIDLLAHTGPDARKFIKP